jgi:hypothetical protein
MDLVQRPIERLIFSTFYVVPCFLTLRPQHQDHQRRGPHDARGRIALFHFEYISHKSLIVIAGADDNDDDNTFFFFFFFKGPLVFLSAASPSNHHHDQVYRAVKHGSSKTEQLLLLPDLILM